MKNGVDTTIGTWRPRLIRLTQIGNPDVEDGKPQPCYIDPSQIMIIYRAMGSFTKAKGDKLVDERHPLQPCTQVVGVMNNHLTVTETPDQVAALRDRALGYGAELKEA